VRAQHLNRGISESPDCLQILHSFGGGASSRSDKTGHTAWQLHN
jgi:hypothetical protein